MEKIFSKVNRESAAPGNKENHKEHMVGCLNNVLNIMPTAVLKAVDADIDGDFRTATTGYQHDEESN